LAAYIFFGYTMFSILKDFRWFIALRHDWLRLFNCRNYTILIRNIPEELRSDNLLTKHFQGLYGKDRGKNCQLAGHPNMAAKFLIVLFHISSGSASLSPHLRFGKHDRREEEVHTQFGTCFGRAGN
jgi:hypothetical protein